MHARAWLQPATTPHHPNPACASAVTAVTYTVAHCKRSSCHIPYPPQLLGSCRTNTQRDMASALVHPWPVVHALTQALSLECLSGAPQRLH